MGVQKEGTAPSCERVGWGPGVGTLASFLEHRQPNSGLLKTTMRCSGSPKCDCTLFRGDGRAKRCKSCRHDQGSHYETSSDDDSGDGDSGSSHDNSSNDTNLDTSDDNDDSESSSDTVRRPSASMKNKATVSSLVADLLNDGKSSRTEVEDAKREAKAGLMKKKVCSMFAEL